MAISMFATRSMMAAIALMPPKRTFLRETFFATVVEFETSKVDVDIYKGNQKMAPFVSPIIGGKTMTREGFKTSTFEPALIAPDTITTAGDILTRSPGENIYNPKSAEDRAAEMLMKDMADLDSMITTREEWMAAQALFTGAVTCTGEGVSVSVDFGMSSSHKITLGAGSKWTDSGVKPLDNIKTWRDLIIKDSFINPDICILGATALSAFLNNDDVLKKLDTRYVELGTIKPEQLPNGVTYIGSDRLSGVDYYSYIGFYVDPADGLQKPFVPDNKVLLGSRQARTSMLYGAVALIDQDTEAFNVVASARVPDSWIQKKPAARFVQISSRPLPVPHDIDAFVVATVV